MTEQGLGSLTGLSQDDIVDITKNKTFKVQGNEFQIGNFNHHLRLKALEIVEDLGQSKRIAATLSSHSDGNLRQLFNQITNDGMSISKLPTFFDEKPELFIPLTLTVLHLYAAPFLSALTAS
ncbi:MAG TPA: hypothetical protein ACHBZ9_15425 [Arsenophonus nasoniae]|uniref:hypothetical protein n=1 Tax=Arsenophonus nasoniae TaxID=638 RepID=UPI00387A1F91